MVEPTKTTNKIHFVDLSYERFEDLGFQLAYRYKNWVRISHFGRSGNDDGIDIYGDVNCDGNSESWIFQCKRYKTIDLGQMRKAIDKCLDKNDNIPDAFVFILACNVSKKNQEKITKYASERRIKKIFFWDGAVLEAMLYWKYTDLLLVYFDIDLAQRRQSNISKIKRRLSLKKRIKSQVESYFKPGIGKDVIIRNVDNDVYPDLPDLPGISPWFRLGFYKDYFRGVSFYLSNIDDIRINMETKTWQINDTKSLLPLKENEKIIQARLMGDIPYDNIVDFDLYGDEYYPYIHFFCEFNNLGEPYEKFWYLPMDKSIVIRLNNDNTYL